MGRRKIEIKAIKDDRNRSVTFLKRKGGLFKKAHELSVLCSVDVAVIIFGHNKKLYEFSSGDINETIGRYQYYGQPHEHKGPADFRGKNGGDEEDEEDEDMSPPREGSMPPQQHPQMMPPHIQHQPPFGHLRHPVPSASPPSQNGMYPGQHGSPQPQMASRPPSRETVRRSSSNLVPMQHPRATTPQPPQNGFAYMPNQPQFDPRAHPNLNPPSTAPPQFQHFPHHSSPQPMHHHPQHPPQPQPQQHVQHPQVQQAHQAHQAFLQEQRRQSMPPSMPQQERPESTPPMQHQQAPSQSPQPPAQPSLRLPEQQSPPQPKHLSSKSRSIFTPIDASGSVLASHFFGRSPDPPRPEIKEEDSPELKARIRHQPATGRSSTHPVRSNTMSSDGIIPPSRTSTNNSMKSAAARPRLKVQIPSEASDAESGTAEDSSPAGTNQHSGATTGMTAAPLTTGSNSTPSNRGRSDSHHSASVVLPPPSPSASALLSAGASGPPNPFARPPFPPTATSSNQANNSNAYADNRNNNNNNNNNMDTPISALPSRFVADNLLPSPSSFYPDWGFGGRSGGHDSGMLPSPLTFPTPVVAVGAPQGWGRQSLETGMGTGTGTGTGALAGLGMGMASGGGGGGGGGGVGEKRKESGGGPPDDRGVEGTEPKKARV